MLFSCTYELVYTVDTIVWSSIFSFSFHLAAGKVGNSIFLDILYSGTDLLESQVLCTYTKTIVVLLQLRGFNLSVLSQSLRPAVISIARDIVDLAKSIFLQMPF